MNKGETRPSLCRRIIENGGKAYSYEEQNCVVKLCEARLPEKAMFSISDACGYMSKFICLKCSNVIIKEVYKDYKFCPFCGQRLEYE